MLMIRLRLGRRSCLVGIATAFSVVLLWIQFTHNPWLDLRSGEVERKEQQISTFADGDIPVEEIGIGVSNYASHFCNISASSDVTLTNYTGGVIVDLDEFIIWDNVPILSRSPNASSQAPYATCQLKDYIYFHHFPHFMQQLYRCWSFWQQHIDTHQPVLVTTPPESRPWRRSQMNEFNRAMMEIMPKTGVSIFSPGVLPRSVEIKIIDDGAVSFQDTQSVSAFTAGPLMEPHQNFFQTTSTNDMVALRTQVLLALGWKNPSKSGCFTVATRNNESRKATTNRRRIPRIAIINRKRTRRLLNAPEVLQDLRLFFDLPYEIQIIYFESKSFKEQVEILANIDILITPHGAQETGLIFLPQCGGILEILPYRYYIPKFFGTLAATCGIHHAFLYLAQNVSDHGYFHINRDTNLCPPLDKLRHAVTLLAEKWESCCEVGEDRRLSYTKI